MSKQNLGINEDRKRCREFLKKEQPGWCKERLIALKMGLDSGRTLDEIAEVVACDRSTVQRLFQRFCQGGL